MAIRVELGVMWLLVMREPHCTRKQVNRIAPNGKDSALLKPSPIDLRHCSPTEINLDEDHRDTGSCEMHTVWVSMDHRTP